MYRFVQEYLSSVREHMRSARERLGEIAAANGLTVKTTPVLALQLYIE